MRSLGSEHAAADADVDLARGPLGLAGAARALGGPPAALVLADLDAARVEWAFLHGIGSRPWPVCTTTAPSVAGPVRQPPARRPARGGQGPRPHRRRRPRLHREPRHVLPGHRGRARAARTAPTRAATPASSRARRRARSRSPATTATACSCRSATRSSTPRSGCCSSASSAAGGCGSTAPRASSLDDPLLASWPGAKLVVRVRGPRGLPQLPALHPPATSWSSARASSRSRDEETPVPDWKRTDWAQDVLPGAIPQGLGRAARDRAAQHHARLGLRRAELRLELPQQAVELGGVAAGDPQLVVEAPASRGRRRSPPRAWRRRPRTSRWCAPGPCCTSISACRRRPAAPGSTVAVKPVITPSRRSRRTRSAAALALSPTRAPRSR